MHIDHVGIAVGDLEKAVETYEKILNTKCSKREVVESEKVETHHNLIMCMPGAVKCARCGGRRLRRTKPSSRPDAYTGQHSRGTP